jgi:DedD protein
MGLFSFLSKNKQDRNNGSSAEDSGRFTRAEDAALGERARSKRASTMGADGGRRRAPTDPVLPEKKRARRRLVGAIALALAAAVGLPMLLDSEPKPLAGDIAIQIPSKEKAPPLPMPSAPVAAADSVDSGEEIVEAPEDLVRSSSRSVATVDTTPAPPVKTEAVKHAPSAEPEHVKPEPKPAPKAEARLADAKPVEKTPPKPAAKPEDKPEHKPEHKPAAHANDDSRALAILEDKEAAKQVATTQRFVVQAAALGTQEKVTELQNRLKSAGIQTFTQKQGALIRVRVGPVNKDDAEKLRARLQGLGLSPTLVPL